MAQKNESAKQKIEIKIVEEKPQTEQERKDYCGTIHAVFPRLEKDIKEALHARLVYTAMETKDWEALMLSRGIMEGMSILLEQWRSAHSEHIANSQPETNFDKHNPLAE